MTAGFVAEKYTPLLSVEFNLHAAATYAANFGEDHTIFGDIKDVARKQIPRADLVVGGPPCQGFSNLGSKNIDDPRNQLWREYLRVVSIAKPKVFVIENVDRFLKSAEFELLKNEADCGSLKGYKLSYGHLNAADFGVAQRRIRTIVIGSRVGQIELPKATHARNPAPGSELLRWNGTKTQIKDLPARPRPTVCPRARSSSSVKSCRECSRPHNCTSAATRHSCRCSDTTMCRQVAAASMCPIIYCHAAGARSPLAQPMSWAECSGISLHTQSEPSFTSQRKVRTYTRSGMLAAANG